MSFDLVLGGLTAIGLLAYLAYLAYAIFASMLVLFVGALGLTYGSEIQGNPILAELPVEQTAGNMEGKEARFGTRPMSASP